jgi:hypothetical protein
MMLSELHAGAGGVGEHEDALAAPEVGGRRHVRSGRRKSAGPAMIRAAPDREHTSSALGVEPRLELRERL